MANLAERFRRFRFVRKRSSPVLKIVLLVTILLSTVVLIALGIFIKGEQAKADAWRDQAALEQQKNQELNNNRYTSYYSYNINAICSYCFKKRSCINRKSTTTDIKI